MVHERPYKPAQTHEEALNELRRHAGAQFDPDVVDLFCSLYAEGVPPDGLEEVYRLHERARGGLERIDVRAAAKALSSTPRTRVSRTSGSHQPDEEAHSHLLAPTEPATPASNGRPKRKRRSGAARAVTPVEPPGPSREGAQRTGNVHEAAG
jgi:hypothetical protein